MENLYFIAIVPPVEIQEEITWFKEEIAMRYGSKHALNAPPHITLHMPFRWKDKKRAKLLEVMELLNSELQSFEIALKDFGFFEPRVVFVSVEENDKLNQLQKYVVDVCRRELKLDNGNFKNKAFHPHVTIGFRDLRKKMFYEAKEEFEKRAYSQNFLLGRIDLLKHDGKSWNVMIF